MEILAIIAKQLKLLLRNRLAVLITIAVPIVLTYLFSMSMNVTKEKLYIADSDNSVYSRKLISMLKGHNDIAVVKATEDEIKKEVDKQYIPMGLVIYKNFGDELSSGNTSKIKIIQNYESGDSETLEQAITGEVATLKKIVVDSRYISSKLNEDASNYSSKLLNNTSSASNMTITDKGEKAGNNTLATLIGFTTMFIWFVVVQGFRTLVDERENSTTSRLLSTPTSYNKYLFSKIVSIYLFGICNIIAIMVAGKYILNINISTNNVGTTATIFAAYLLVITGITSVIVLFAKKQQNFTMSTSVFIAITGILGGCFFSMDVAPNYMQLASKITPEAWAIGALKEVIFNGYSLSSELLPLSIFISVSILGFIISNLIINSRLKKGII